MKLKVREYNQRGEVVVEFDRMWSLRELEVKRGLLHMLASGERMLVKALGKNSCLF